MTQSVQTETITRFGRLARRMRRAGKAEEGATAVEFAMLAMPFFALLFGIIELSIVFFVGSNVQNATFEASRQIRVGAFSGNENQFKNIICREMNPGKKNSELGACRQKLSIKVKTMSDFSQATAFAPPPAAPDPNAPPPPNFTASAGGETVIVTASYRFPLTLPGNLTGLSNVNNGNFRDIKAVVAFRNEPF